jgi:hypothetical protein
MSNEEIEYNSSSNISSNYQSPKNTSTKNNTISPSINPYIIYTKTLLHILSENKKSNDYYKKIESNYDGHFTYKVKPPISLLDYLKRIIKYLKIEFSTLIISMIYIDRVCKERVFINEYNIHRVMLIAIYIAYTFNEDCIHDNNYLALVSGISKKEMVLLENEFLELIDFKLFVSDDTFNEYKKYFFRDFNII